MEILLAAPAEGIPLWLVLLIIFLIIMLILLIMLCLFCWMSKNRSKVHTVPPVYFFPESAFARPSDPERAQAQGLEGVDDLEESTVEEGCVECLTRSTPTASGAPSVGPRGSRMTTVSSKGSKAGSISASKTVANYHWQRQ